MMNPLSPHPHPKTYTRYDGAGRRDLKLVISSLVIGLCVGAGGVYLGHSLPLTQHLQKTQTALATLATAQDLCRKENTLTNETLETALHQLTICQTDLQVARRRLSAAPTAPILTTPVPPGAASPSAPAEEAGLSSTPALSPESLPPVSLPILPKPPPGRSETLPETPAPSTPPLTLQAETPPAPTPAATTSVWQDSWPPKPLARPARPTPAAPAALDDEGEEDSGLIAPSVREPAAALAPVSGRGAGRINVGQEVTLAGSLRVRLIAVSQRTSGKYCVVAGDGFDSARIASGTSKRITRGTQTITLSARVEDGDTCQLSVSSR